jgi:hypothetical protein
VCNLQRMRRSPATFFGFGFQIINLIRIIIFGGHKAVVRPDPIPNSAVKRSLADGSGFIDSARVGRRQFFKKPKRKFRLFYSIGLKLKVTQ